MQNNCKNICTIQKKAVPLHSLSAKSRYFATVAQLVEQRIRNAWVGGSSPPSGSKRRRTNLGASLVLPFGHGLEPLNGVPDTAKLCWGEGGQL